MRAKIPEKKPDQTPANGHLKFAQNFLKSSLHVSRAGSKNKKITFDFTDEGFDPLAIPKKFIGNVYRITFPNVINMRTPHVWSKIRMITDMGSAWIKHAESNPILETYGLDDRTVILEALEKARRETLLFENLTGARENFIRHFLLKDRNKDLQRKIARDQIVAEGFYCAALCHLMPEMADKRPDISFIGNLWEKRIDASIRLNFKGLFDHKDNADEYLFRARLIIEDFYSQFARNIRAFTAGDLKNMGINSSQKQERRAWVGKNLLEFHEQLVTRRVFNRDQQQVRMRARDFRHVSIPATTHREYAHSSSSSPVSQFAGRSVDQPVAPEYKPKIISGSIMRILYPEDQAAFMQGPARIFGKEDAYPEGLEPIWIKLADVFKQVTSDEFKRMRFSTVDLSWRQDDYLASYKKLRQNHEMIAPVSTLYPDREKLEKDWAELQKEQPALVRTSRMLSKKFESWMRTQSGYRPQFDCEEGQVDLSKLANIIIDPNNNAAYIGEQADRQIDTSVSLLFDFSGSMAGIPIETAMLMSHGLSTALEKCRIPCEVLGFTTTGPGALHIIVKEFKDRLRQCSANFAIACDSKHMGGTNDTDAILWATTRLLARPEKRKILVVVSDVQPNSSFIAQDYPDLSYNGLLKSAIMHVQKIKGIELAAIGIGDTQANEYYPNSINVMNISDLGPALVNRLQVLLDPAQAVRSYRKTNSPSPEII